MKSLEKDEVNKESIQVRCVESIEMTEDVSVRVTVSEALPLGEALLLLH